eukprot:749343-Hanusia_phi.AAC.5
MIPGGQLRCRRAVCQNLFGTCTGTCRGGTAVKLLTRLQGLQSDLSSSQGQAAKSATTIEEQDVVPGHNTAASWQSRLFLELELC